MIQKIHTFQNCQILVEDVPNPQGEVEGRAFVIVDQDTGDVYRCPMPFDVAKIQGQRLMGIGALELAGKPDLEKAIAQINGKAR